LRKKALLRSVCADFRCKQCLLRGWQGCPRFSYGIHPKQEGTPLKDFFDTWKFKILVAVAVFLVGIMAYAGANGRLTAAPQELLGVVLMPLQKVTSALSGGIGSVWEKYTSIDEVMEQNEQLEAENAELLDWGTVNGAAVNDAVISDKGYLIGMVVEADTTSCKVMTILHPSFSAAGVVSRTRENGIINGSTDYAGDGLCVLTNLERATETKMGDQVITTGLGGVFPPDLLVGTVQKVEPEVSGKSSIAVVRPGADPRTVKHVFVITDY